MIKLIIILIQFAIIDPILIFITRLIVNCWFRINRYFWGRNLVCVQSVFVWISSILLLPYVLTFLWRLINSCFCLIVLLFILYNFKLIIAMQKRVRSKIITSGLNLFTSFLGFWIIGTILCFALLVCGVFLLFWESDASFVICLLLVDRYHFWHDFIMLGF